MEIKSFNKFKDMILEVSDERGINNDGIWVYLNLGYEVEEGLTTIHEYTVKECVARLKEVYKVDIVEVK